MRFPSHPLKAFTLGLVIPLVVVACADAVGGDAEDLSISIASPADGATVSVPFDVQLDASVSIGEPETGNHHAHLYFDTGTDATSCTGC